MQTTRPPVSRCRHHDHVTVPKACRAQGADILINYADPATLKVRILIDRIHGGIASLHCSFTLPPYSPGMCGSAWHCQHTNTILYLARVALTRRCNRKPSVALCGCGGNDGFVCTCITILQKKLQAAGVYGSVDVERGEAVIMWQPGKDCVLAPPCSY